MPTGTLHASCLHSIAVAVMACFQCQYTPAALVDRFCWNSKCHTTLCDYAEPCEDFEDPIGLCQIFVCFQVAPSSGVPWSVVVDCGFWDSCSPPQVRTQLPCFTPFPTADNVLGIFALIGVSRWYSCRRYDWGDCSFCIPQYYLQGFIAPDRKFCPVKEAC